MSPRLNEHSPAIHRKEAAVTAALPAGIPAPSLIGTFDDGEWVALVLSDVEGRHPHLPWRSVELICVLDALFELSRTPVPPALDHLPALEHELADAFDGWKRIGTDPPEECDPWVLKNLDALGQLAEDGLKDLAGVSLVHTDVRSDNILMTAHHGAVLVDWPWACVGSPWIDGLTVLINVRVSDPEFDVESVLRSHQIFSQATAGGISRVLSGLGAYFTDAARQPPPSGLPTVRAFQQRQSDAVVRWLWQRLSHL